MECTPTLLLAGVLVLAARTSAGDERPRSVLPASDPADLSNEELLGAIHAALAEPTGRGLDSIDTSRDDGSTADAPPSVAAILVPDAKRLSFQAMLTDTNGDPLAGASVDLEFRIYDGGTNALLEGPIAMNGVALTGGVVDVQIPISGASFNGPALELAVSTNGQAEMTPRIALTAVPYAMRVDRVASDELDNVIQLGDATASGNLVLYGSAGTGTLELRGVNGSIEADGHYSVVDSIGGDTYGSLAMTSAGGEFKLWDSAGNLGYKISGNPLFGGSLAEYYQADGAVGVTIASEAIFGSVLWMHNNTGATTITLDSDNNAGHGSIAVGNGSETAVYIASADNKISIRGDDGNERAKLSGVSYGLLELFDSTGPTEKTAELSATSSNGGSLTQWQGDGGGSGVTLTGDAGDLGGRATFFNSSGNTRLSIFGDGGNGSGKMTLYDASGTLTVDILGSELGADGAEIHLREADGTQTIVLDAEHDLGGAYFSLYNEIGESTVMLDGQYGEELAGLIRVRESGNTRILLDAKDGSAGSRALNTGASPWSS